jgi:hypothetical protein
MGGAFSRLSKLVDWHAGYHPTPPTVAQVEAALKADNRRQILDWWRHCQAGTIVGPVGTAMKEALNTVEKRCSEDDAKELMNGTNSEGSNSRSVVRDMRLGSNTCVCNGELVK